MRDCSCPFCNGLACVVHDSPTSRAYECQHCGAIRWITKSTTQLAWWYHGWQSLDTDDTPGLRIDGDGVKSAAPIRYLDWAKLATESNVNCLKFT